MYSVAVSSQLFIAHSLDDPFFGPAQNLHGATLTVNAEIYSNVLNELGIVIDIGYFDGLVTEILSELDYSNLDEMDEFNGKITSIEFLCGYIFDKIRQQLFVDKGDLISAPLEKLKITVKESATAWASYEEDLSL